MRSKQRRAFTLVELLVVIAIIGILIALLLPAVQAAREAARRLQCSNNLKQLALAAMMHESTHGSFPSGGWADWSGDADAGFGRQQPGSFLFSILPYIEQQSLHEMGEGASPADKLVQHALRNEIPVAGFHCPSRRAADLYPTHPNMSFRNANAMEQIAKNDYAANLGRYYLLLTPPSTLNPPPDFDWHENEFDGVCFLGSEVKISSVSDGTTCTYFCGEKYLNPDNYSTYVQLEYGDDQGAYCGYNADVHRLTSVLPLQDTPGATLYDQFGSAHPGVFHMAFCDGSVQAMSFDIEARLHENLGNRSDGEVTGSKEF